MDNVRVPYRGSHIDLSRADLDRVLRLMEPVAMGESYSTPEAMASIFRPMLMGREQEHLALACFDNRMTLVGAEIVTIGTPSASMVPVGVVLRRALLMGGTRIAVAHNHPSGDPTPSQQDIDVTSRLGRACMLIEMPLMDHMIITDGSWVSMSARGLLPWGMT